MRKLARVTLWPLASLASMISSAIMIRDDVNDADYRALAQRPQFSMVGLVEVRFAGGGGQNGTGTFIGFGNNKAWVLTAEHVLDGYGIENSRFRIGDQAWRFGDSYSYLSDMAVIPIVGLREGDLRPARFINYTLPFTQRLEDRVVGTFVGFGKSGTGKKPDTVDGGVKRAGQQRIDGFQVKTYRQNGDVFQEWEGYMSDFDDGTAASNTLDRTDNTKRKLGENQTSSRAQERFEAGTGPGDSGGPLFVEINQGWLTSDWVIAGVNVERVNGGGYSSWQHFLPVNENYSRWITEKTGIRPVPEPASLTVLGAGLLLLARRKNRWPAGGWRHVSARGTRA